MGSYATPQDKLLVEAKSYTDSCDFCDSIEGGHYCLLHTMMLKNANLLTCKDFTRSGTEKRRKR